MFVFFAGAVLALSSVALYLAPSCGVARTFGWMFLSLTKDDWTNVHVIVGFAMAIPLALHAYLNRRAIFAYVRRKAGEVVEYRLETAVALLVTTSIVTAVIWFPEQSAILASLGKTFATNAIAVQAGW